MLGKFGKRMQRIGKPPTQCFKNDLKNVTYNLRIKTTMIPFIQTSYLESPKQKALTSP